MGRVIKKEYKEKKFKLVGEDLFSFMVRVGIELDSRYTKTENSYKIKCTQCLKEITVEDYYIDRDTGFAVISFAHDHCKMGGPLVMVPYLKETKNKWYSLLDDVIYN